MGENSHENALQIPLRKSLAVVVEVKSLRDWVDAYFDFEVTTVESSRKVQQRDLDLFCRFFEEETRSGAIENWTPRLSQAFLTSLRGTVNGEGKRQWNDRAINRVLAHLKTFAKWVHKVSPFPLGNPMEKIRSAPAGSLRAIERALTQTERRRILDAADMLVKMGGRSRDRNRFKGEERPVRKNYRPWRNRAVVYLLIETGMRRAAAAALKLHDVDFERKRVSVVEKGGVTHPYKISVEGLRAISDYNEKERGVDAAHFGEGGALFLPAIPSQNKSGCLHPNAINDIWNEVCAAAGVEQKTPHSARHAMGKFLIERTGNIEAVQRQLGHKNAAYSLQYSRIADEELEEILEAR